ncbi:YbgC/FadM family acyl-CoA thioesterase [Enterobacter cloacae]
MMKEKEEDLMWSSLLNSSREWQFRVPFSDIDTGKVVYHACYLRYFDQARTEWFRAHDINLAKMIEEHDTAWIVCHTDVSYHSPARFDETLTITTSLSRQQHARFVFTQFVSCDGKPRVSAHISMATVSVSTLKPVRPPSLLSAMKTNSFIRTDSGV